jgi:hypothetical protein
MGMDGRQSLEIRGPKESLDELENSAIVIASASADYEYIAKRFFGKENIRMGIRTHNHLSISYEFRNYPVYEYLLEILRAHPKCWLKNEYYTDEGPCGIWIAYMNCETNVPIIEQLDWEEPCIEAKCFGEDFSKK